MTPADAATDTTVADMLSAIADLIWPLLAVGLLVFLFSKRKALGPWLKELIRTRNVRAQLPGGFRFEVGGQPVSAQQVVDDQRAQTEQLREKLSLHSAQLANLREAMLVPAEPDLEAEAKIEASTRRVLWVDDRPNGNAYELAALKDRGVRVDVATSTAEALERLANDAPFDAIVTDMHRTEDGESRDTAGLTLLRELRRRGFDLPTVVYASESGVERHGGAAQELGAVGATAKSTELLELLAVNYGPGFSTRFAGQVQGELKRSGWNPIREPRDSPIDFRSQHDGQPLGIDVKAWGRDVGTARLRAKLDAIDQARYDFPVWIVTPDAVQIPREVSLPEGVELLSFADLRARLAKR